VKEKEGMDLPSNLGDGRLSSSEILADMGKKSSLFGLIYP